ncbi:MAG: LamG domain-containing protein [Verrucomicrobiota bacterium]
MFPNKQNSRLDEILSRLVDGMATDPEIGELEKILSQDSTSRERYRLFMATHLELATHPLELPKSLPIPFWQRAGLPLAAAAVLTLFTGTILWRTTRNPDSAQQANVKSYLPVLAVTSRVQNATWDHSDPLATGTKLCRGLITLKTGLITLDLIGGEQITLKAPARFDMISQNEMMLHSGDAALLMKKHGGSPYIIRVPGGAVVDLGTEISVNVNSEGVSDVRVFDGKANVSSMDASGRTRHERLLLTGESVQIGKTLATSKKDEQSFLRSLTPVTVDHSAAGKPYHSVINHSQPLAWWSFEPPASSGNIAPKAGTIPLLLGGKPRIVGSEEKSFMLTNSSDAAGFAVAESAIAGLDTEAGLSVEFLIHPSSENGTAFAFDQPELPVPQNGLDGHGPHSPHRMLIERSGLSGSGIGHIHSDFALRVMFRSPAGYEGGTNSYSTESHLMHRWIHVVYTHDGIALRLYIDGKLSDEVPSDLPFQNADLRPIIGRMQPLPIGIKRQWHGGIDEVALYGRALSAEEIETHASALER